MQALQIEDNNEATTPLLSSPSQRKDGKNKLAIVGTVIATLVLVGVITVTATRRGPVQVGRQQAVVGAPHVPHGDYYLTENVGNYEDAKRQCAASGGEMASIHNDDENGEVSELCGSRTRCWIGFSDEAEEGTWVWEDGSDNSYTNWLVKPGQVEPNNHGGIEHCGVINWDYPLKWNDAACTTHKFPYKGVCQKIPTLDSYPCPPGTFDKQKHVEGQPCVCEECPAGKFCVGYLDGENQDPEPCAKGTYQKLTGQSQCDESPPGHSVPDEGSTNPTPCPAGQYQDEYGKASCKACTKGNKCPGTGNVNPTQCDEGEYQDETNQTSCDPCPMGNKCPNKGMINPTQCHFGKYQDNEGETSCKVCPEGNKCPDKGMDTPAKCPVDYYQACTQQIDCLPCERSLTTTTSTNGQDGQSSCTLVT